MQYGIFSMRRAGLSASAELLVLAVSSSIRLMPYSAAIQCCFQHCIVCMHYSNKDLIQLGFTSRCFKWACVTSIVRMMTCVNETYCSPDGMNFICWLYHICCLAYAAKFLTRKSSLKVTPPTLEIFSSCVQVAWPTTLTSEPRLVWHYEMNQHAAYLGQKLFRLEVVIRTHRHMPAWLLNQSTWITKAVGK